MFEIDLLKEKGRPRKTDVKRLVFRIIVLLIPLTAAMVYAVDLRKNCMELEALRKSADDNTARLDEYADDLRFLDDLTDQINSLSLSVSEIGQALRFRLAMSSVLVELADTLPDEICMREMDWKRTAQHDRIPDPTTGKVRFETSIKRLLKLSLYSRDNTGSDAAVQNYIAQLDSAPALSDIVKEIRLASREQTEIKGDNAIVYNVEIYLKDQR